MQTIDPLTSRVLEELSVQMGRPLEIVSQPGEDPNIVVSKIGSETLAVKASGSHPLSSAHRNFLNEFVQLLHRDLLHEQDRRRLDQRLRNLERENLELSSRNSALAEISSRDALTGLFNRCYMLDKIEIEINRALRHGTSMSLLLLDIDHFKQVNDSFGHSAGDDVLRNFGMVLKESCRVYDVPGRYGGEEFCLMLPQTGVQNTLTVAERIRSRVEKGLLDVGQGQVRVTTSIGVAGIDSPDPGVFNASSLIDRADRALYSAKNRGRNRIEVWDSSLSPMDH